MLAIIAAQAILAGATPEQLQQIKNEAEEAADNDPVELQEQSIWESSGLNVLSSGYVGFIYGQFHGIAMVANAATFHQIDSIDSYVDNAIAENGGAYGTANVFAHIGAWAGEAAAVLYVAGAYLSAPLYHYTTAEGAAGIAETGIIRAQVWATNIPPSIMAHPVGGNIARLFLGWVGPYRLTEAGVQLMPLTHYFQVSPSSFTPSLLKVFQFWSNSPVTPL